MSNFTIRKSDGRGQVYWYYNIIDEQNWNNSKVFPSIEDNQQLNLIIQQEQQLLYIADKDHKVLLRHVPNESFITYLKQNKIKLPELIYIKELSEAFKEASVDNQKPLLIPYIVSDCLEDFAEEVELFGGKKSLVKQLNNKIII